MAAARNGSHTAADAVDQIHQRNAIKIGEVLNEATLPALAPRTAETGTALDRVVLAADRHRTTVDFADAGNIGRRREREQIARVVIFRTAGEFADFLKAVGIEQTVDALADGQLAGGVMTRHRLGAAALLGKRATAPDFFDFCGPAHGTPGVPRQADAAGLSVRQNPLKTRGYPSARPLLLSIRLLTI